MGESRRNGKEHVGTGRDRKEQEGALRKRKEHAGTGRNRWVR